MASIQKPAGDEEEALAVGPSSSECRLQLERILASPTLQASARRRLLLRYIVEETLDGRADLLKGYAIALAVFNRDGSFDAQSDPVVRLEARRLRRDLDCYYAGAGSHDRIRISIPRGGYIARFEWMKGGAGSRPLHPGEPNDVVAALVEREIQIVGTPSRVAEIHQGGRSRWEPGRRVAAILAVLLFCAATGLIWSNIGARGSSAGAGGPTMIVLPFEALSLRDNDRFLAAGLTQQLISNLIQFDAVRLYSLPASFVQDNAADLTSIGRRLAVAYVVKGSLRSQGDTVWLSTQLIDAYSGKVIFSETYDRPMTTTTLIDVQEELADRVSGALRQSLGVMTGNPDDRPSGKAPGARGS